MNSEPRCTDDERLASIERIRASYNCDDNGYVSFDRALEGEFNVMGQYAAAFVDGFGDKPKLAADLVIGNPDNWYTLKIKPEDVIIFGERLQAYRTEQIARIESKLS